MARKDALSNKGPLSGNNRSKALNSTRRRWNVNLQKVRVKNPDNSVITVKVSARTLKTLKKHNRLA